ncbi:gluconokinase [Pseudoalteromonas sp. MMG010]|uniref:gluconokinase n=1 Tax=Pseudoalteromonas sp. MMG010 TaxID=2822685 RepID=UPI001B39F2DA|nr:gluconokinase [Pseudoalteromonas sp. MMG010]MBQ4832054.1 gluconokinase [Pseudoalteromonas sp. MMG010]
MIVVVCGVSGTGKSTVGKAVSETLNLPFFDADDFHSKANIQKMKNGIALNDTDRKPWLEQLSQQLCLWEKEGKGAVLACSALKESYRITLASNCMVSIKWVMLHGSRELLLSRLNSRQDHFFDASLLESQLNTLELPQYGLTLDVKASVNDIVEKISRYISAT